MTQTVERVLRPDVDETLGLVEQAGLSWDHVAVLPRHLEHVATISGRQPDLRIVIDHLAKPPIGEAEHEPWWTLIGDRRQELARARQDRRPLPPTETPPAARSRACARSSSGRSTSSALPAHVRRDWPVSIRRGYGPVLGGLRTMLADLSAPEAEDVWSGTARRCYGLAPA